MAELYYRDNHERNSGFKVAVYNRTTDKVDDFVQGRAKGKQIRGCYTREEQVASLSRPCKLIALVKAGHGDTTASITYNA